MSLPCQVFSVKFPICGFTWGVNNAAVLPFRFAAVLLGAGASARMGRPKLVLPWGDTTILGHLLEQWRRLGAAQIAVVCAPGKTAVAEELDRLGFPASTRIINPAPEAGMFSSIQCAARWDGWDAGVTHWILTLGDQPHVRETTLESLRDHSRQYPADICQPSRHGRPRHPVVFPKPVWRSLGQSSTVNLKEFLQAGVGQVKLVEVDDAGLDLDLDRPEDYERERALSHQ